MCIWFSLEGWSELCCLPSILWISGPGFLGNLMHSFTSLTSSVHWRPEEWRLDYTLMNMKAESLCPEGHSQPLLDVEMLLEVYSCTVSRSPSVGANNATSLGSTLANCIQLTKLALYLIILICITDAYDQNLPIHLAVFHNGDTARVRGIDQVHRLF